MSRKPIIAALLLLLLLAETPGLALGQDSGPGGETLQTGEQTVVGSVSDVGRSPATKLAMPTPAPDDKPGVAGKDPGVPDHAAASGQPQSTPAPGKDAPQIDTHTSILVISSHAVIGTSLLRALNELNRPYTQVSSEDWTTIDFSPYNTVIAAINGDAIDDADIAAVRTNVLDMGKRLIFFGGTQLQGFRDAVNSRLLTVSSAFDWKISAAPSFRLLSAGHALAQGLPASRNWLNPQTGYYMIRPTDTATTYIAANGDGQKTYFYKRIGGGNFVWFANPVDQQYWAEFQDYLYLKHIVQNSLDYIPLPQPGNILLLATTRIDHSVIRVLREMGWGFTQLVTDNWTSIDFRPYSSVIAAMDGGAIDDADIAAVRTKVVDTGKRLIFVGGTDYAPFITAVNNRLLKVDTTRHSWEAPYDTSYFNFSDAGLLNEGLVDEDDWQNGGADYAMAHSTDPAAQDITTNINGEPTFLIRRYGNGDFIWFTPTPYEAVWTNEYDYNVLRTSLANALYYARPQSGLTLVISNTDISGSALRALNELGVQYNTFGGDDWTSVNLIPYNTVILALDGGSIEAPSVQRLRTQVLDYGHRLVILGGSGYQPFEQAMSDNIFAVSGAGGITDELPPDWKVINSGHVLAAGLPATRTWANGMIRYREQILTDTARDVIAQDGAGFDIFATKRVGNGNVVWFADSPASSLWTNATDYSYFKRLLQNSISYASRDPSNTLLLSDANVVGSVQKALNQLGIGYEVGSIVAGPLKPTSSIDYTRYNTVIVAMDTRMEYLRATGYSSVEVQEWRQQVIDAEKRLIFVGSDGTAAFAAAVSSKLLAVTVATAKAAAQPQWTLLDNNHPLAQNLPATRNFTGPYGGVYVAKVTDSGNTLIGRNGDNQKALLTKRIGSGQFIWLTYGALSDSWTNAADFAFLRSVVGNSFRYNPHAPLAHNEAFTTSRNTAVTVPVLVNDSDVDGAPTPSMIALVGAPAHGTAAILADGRITFTPANGYTGAASFAYKLCDPTGLCSGNATVSVNVINPATGCVAPNPINLVGVSASGPNFTRTLAGGGWSAGGSSSQAITSGTGSVTANASTQGQFTIGLTKNATTASYTDIDYAIQTAPSVNRLLIYEKGVQKATVVGYADGDVLKVAVETGNKVRYYKNATLLYSSTVTAAGFPLRLDASIATFGFTVQNLFICKP